MSKDEKYITVSRKEYEKLKQKLIKFEKTNRRCIAMIFCDGNSGWCEMGDNSALIYKYLVCMPEGKVVSMTDDSDSFYSSYEIGKIKARGPDTVRARLKHVGMYGREVAEAGKIFFFLKYPVSEKEIDRIRTDELSRQSMINSILKVDVLDPALYQKMTEVGVRLQRICLSRMDKISREVYGRRLINSVAVIFRNYYRIAEKNDKKTADLNEKLWENILNEIQDILITLQIMAGTKVWKRDVCASIGATVIEMETLVKRQMKRIEKRREEINERKKEDKKVQKKREQTDSEGASGET